MGRPIWFFIFYWIDNEIHHRGQAYVYLRSLGISRLLLDRKLSRNSSAFT